MELKHLPRDLNEMRNVIISSNLVSCYMILDELALKKDKTLHYERFKDEWIETYKNVYKIVSKMKVRKSSRMK